MNALKYLGKVKTFEFDDSIELVPLGDFHIGHKNFQESLLRRYVDYIKSKPNCYCALMGDEIEAEIPSRSSKYGYEQLYGIDKQLDKLYDILNPIKGKILTKVSSTHTGWSRKLILHDIDREIAEKLGAHYLGIGDYWKIKCGRRNYTIYQQHGASSSKYPEYEIKKVMENYPSADVYLLGHIHQLYAKPFTKVVCYGDKRFKKILWGIRTGGFVENKEWALEKVLPHPDIGAVFVSLSSRLFDISVRFDSHFLANGTLQ